MFLFVCSVDNDKQHEDVTISINKNHKVELSGNQYEWSEIIKKTAIDRARTRTKKLHKKTTKKLHQKTTKKPKRWNQSVTWASSLKISLTFSSPWASLHTVAAFVADWSISFILPSSLTLLSSAFFCSSSTAICTSQQPKQPNYILTVKSQSTRTGNNKNRTRVDLHRSS